MPFTFAVLLLAIAASYARGGRLTHLADARLVSTWLLFSGLGLQLAVDVSAQRGWLADASTAGWLLLLLSQLLVVAWLLRNRELPGVLLVAVGLLLNAVVIAANGAMPVDPAAMRAVGVDTDVAVPLGKHTLLTAGTRLPWLADIFPLPPLRSIISVGDVAIAAGLVPLTHALMSWRASAQPRGGRRSASPSAS